MLRGFDSEVNRPRTAQYCDPQTIALLLISNSGSIAQLLAQCSEIGENQPLHFVLLLH